MKRKKLFLNLRYVEIFRFVDFIAFLDASGQFESTLP